MCCILEITMRLNKSKYEINNKPMSLIVWFDLIHVVDELQFLLSIVSRKVVMKNEINERELKNLQFLDFLNLVHFQGD